VRAPCRSRRPIGVLALALIWPGAGTHAMAKSTTLYAEVGYGQATYAFQDEGEPTLTRHLLDLEGGFLRPIAAGGALRLGCSLSLMPATEHTGQDDSYSLITFDMLKLECAGLGRPGGHKWLASLRARAGFGLVRVFAPVNELAMALSATVGCDVGPWYIGLKGHAARFEVDFEPHGTPPDTKYKLYYAGIVFGRALGED
jgi:hypothetical protein